MGGEVGAAEGKEVSQQKGCSPPALGRGDLAGPREELPEVTAVLLVTPWSSSLPGCEAVLEMMVGVLYTLCSDVLGSQCCPGV